MALDFLAGCLGGLVGITVGHPFDTMKVRLQGVRSTRLDTRTSWSCFLDIVKKESVFGLYKGLLSPLYGQVLINSIIFGVHGNILKYANDSTVNPVILQGFAGAIAGASQSLVCSPMELVKIRMQMQGVGGYEKRKDNRYLYRTPQECIYKVYKYENGLRGVFRGLNVTLLREVPAFAVYFSSYAHLCNLLNAFEDNSVSIPRLLICGGFAGIFSWVVSYPFDVMKTRLQMDGMGRNEYHGIMHCMRKGVSNEGVRFFFHGINTTILRAFPVNAATLAVVTVFLNRFKDNELGK